MLLLVVIGANFLVALAASVMAQNTNINKDALVKKGSSMILQTSEAEQTIPVLLSSLLGINDISNVKELTLSSFTDAAKKRCETCAMTMVLQVDVALKFSDTKIKFVRTGGVEITIDKGVIYVTKVPGQIPTNVYTTCGAATCSSIRVQGINLKTLFYRAKALGFSTPAGWSRRVGGTGSRRLPAFFQSRVDHPAQLVGLAGVAACAGIYYGVNKGKSDSKVTGKGGGGGNKNTGSKAPPDAGGRRLASWEDPAKTRPWENLGEQEWGNQIADLRRKEIRAKTNAKASDATRPDQ